MFCLGVFRLQFQNAIVIFEISTLEFVKNELLINTVNIGIGSVFAKDPWSTFSKGPSPDPDRFCKECPLKT